jgi:apolipoprotein N-acyltransferase
MRAAEYALPVFRLCSSGISQYVDPTGKVLASTPFAEEGAVMSAQIQLTTHGQMPPDRWLAKLSVGFTALVAILVSMERARQRLIAAIIPPQ